jgi:hypothetical protein
MKSEKYQLSPHASELFAYEDSRDQCSSLACPPLEAFYEYFNGGYFWNRALLIGPVEVAVCSPLSVPEWNEPGLWKGLYGVLGHPKLSDAWRYPWIHKVKVLKRQKIEAA